jgi:hypothetical protein
VDAGQPDLSQLKEQAFSEIEKKEMDLLEKEWRSGKIKGRGCD